jgi:hypothetical protein
MSFSVSLLFLFISLLTVIESKHTKIYESYKNGEFTDTIFLPDTYLGNSGSFDPCSKIDRAKYIKLLNDNYIQCSGSWCVNGEYSCKNPVNGKTFTSCYHMEHITDRKNSDSEFEKYDKDILGNVVMAYGVWNMQVGQLNWEDIKAEKREIYGVIFDRAYSLVKACAVPDDGVNQPESEDLIEEENNFIDFYDIDDGDIISDNTIIFIVVYLLLALALFLKRQIGLMTEAVGTVSNSGNVVVVDDEENGNNNDDIVAN